jgi:hypothetical protein
MLWHGFLPFSYREVPSQRPGALNLHGNYQVKVYVALISSVHIQQ